jgi:predicted O-methyltransferase YrrM
MDSHGHETGGSGTLQTDTEAPQTAVLMSTAEALRKSQEAFRDLLAELPQTDALSLSDVSPETYWFPDITGWFSETEALHLYTTIKLVRPKSILEIGTFYGRSTATICAAIRSMKSTPPFITIDLDLQSEEQVESTFGEIHGTDSVAMPAECKIAFNLGLSSTEYAKHQLNRYGMTKFVEFKTGDFRSLPGKFDLVFADVLHERNEIERNLADILRRIGPGGILAAHDVSDENKSLIERLAPKAEFISRCETLGIYRIGTDDH